MRLDVSKTTLMAYFRDYAASSAEPSAARIAAFYADSFIVAGPRGSAVFKNDTNFLDWLRHLYEFNQQVGLVSMDVVSVEEPSPLSPLHVLTTVVWGARFRKIRDQLITFRITYLLENSNDHWKIIAYISEKDQETEMRKFGLL